MTAQDRALVARCQRGDTAAFHELMVRHRQMIYAIARAIVLCPDEAEDVAQDAMLCIYRGIGRYDSSRELTAWIRAIAVNCAVSALRRRSRRERSQRLLTTEMVQRAPVGPAADLEREELKRHVREAIEALPLRQRLAVSLFSLDGLSLAETAESLGCSVGTLKSHLFRAREKLGAALLGYVEEADL